MASRFFFRVENNQLITLEIKNSEICSSVMCLPIVLRVAFIWLFPIILIGA